MSAWSFELVRPSLGTSDLEEIVLHRGWSQRRQFVRHSLNNLSGHGRTAFQTDI